MFTPEYYTSRSQDLEEAYQDAGQFYWINRLRQKNSINKIMFSDIDIKSKRIAIRRLKGLPTIFVKMFLKLLEYVAEL